VCVYRPHSDNKPHKVTVAIVAMETVFQHFCPVPKSTHAYVVAMCTNRSEYAFLPSDEVSVFADGTFVSNTRMERVLSGESFNWCVHCARDS
jgi:hypothetical protein